MGEAIESRAFRHAARQNCLKYGQFLIYITSVPALAKYAFPGYQTQSSNGAVSQLMATLVNMNTQITRIRQGLRMGDSHAVPGVSWSDPRELSMSISGKMYFENASQFTQFRKNADAFRLNNGWFQINGGGTGMAVYRPARDGLSNEDPTMSAIKAMPMYAASEAMDAATVLTATDSIREGSYEETQYNEARDRLNGGSMFTTMAIEYYSNAPTGVHNRWRAAPRVAVYLDGKFAWESSIGYLPTSFDYSLHAWVTDNTGHYPTYADISINLNNPLGGYIANVQSGASASIQEVNGVTATTRENYYKSTPKL